MRDSKVKISAVIPAYNEADRVGRVIKETQRFVDEVIVVDDRSTDRTGKAAKKLGAKVVVNEYKKGYLGSIKTGLKKAKGKILVTLDADGEHNPKDIPRLIKPILDEKADLVLGKREKIFRISERFINWLTNFRVKVIDSGTGFRAMRKDLASKLNLKGKCTCGIFVLEASHYGAVIVEVPINLCLIQKRRKIPWSHLVQVFYVLRWLIRLKARR